ncbi:hypothetical protein LptCag_2091 [Leptospirillum ferriphilum]|uniref:Uncharacterized protein n=1 Tax=Leptospirillum ferriphilum TaxID=178606 RepID=A0A094YN47_9BACT|nr:hypothetical protein LptCag_2091 [Leptospirillum ferriphilum]
MWDGQWILRIFSLFDFRLFFGRNFHLYRHPEALQKFFRMKNSQKLEIFDNIQWVDLFPDRIVNLFPPFRSQIQSSPWERIQFKRPDSAVFPKNDRDFFELPPFNKTQVSPILPTNWQSLLSGREKSFSERLIN